jgi:hypothetical protein
MADIANIVEELSKLTVLEAADLVKQLETKPPRRSRLRRPVARRRVPLRRRRRRTRLT